MKIPSLSYLKLDSNNNCFPLNKAPSMMAAMIQLAFVLKQFIFPKETNTAVEKLKMSIFETSCFLLFSKYGLSRASTHPPSERQVMGTNRERTMSQTISLVEALSTPPSWDGRVIRSATFFRTKTLLKFLKW